MAAHSGHLELFARYTDGFAFQIQEIPGKGHGVVATQDLAEHEELLEEEPLLAWLLPSEAASTPHRPHCSYCLRELAGCPPSSAPPDSAVRGSGTREHNSDLASECSVVRCNGSSLSSTGQCLELYCSEKCRQSHWSQVHALICPASFAPAGGCAAHLDALVEYEASAIVPGDKAFGPLVACHLLARTVASALDYVSRGLPPVEAVASAVMSLRGFCLPADQLLTNEINFERTFPHIRALLEPHTSRLDCEVVTLDLYRQVVGLLSLNAQGLTVGRGRQGAGLFTLQSQFNHSCDPNCEIVTSAEDAPGNASRTIVVRTRRAVRAGSELTLSYLSEVGSMSTEERQGRLRPYLFECRCPRCVVNNG
eukprot:gnl/Spiro4/21129_TR10308_c0_g1_i1.p1 gnl/Spiro4/21129_TR10308_c0_g1~~gnl/Spiro4/21129_TR10308_c0_g1_i1.p1  ORF type:complete len:366 (+),score=30.02 gnl/Spiro4/21129_TR10308_c0_g1_i1:124-1221(+)